MGVADLSGAHGAPYNSGAVGGAVRTAADSAPGWSAEQAAAASRDFAELRVGPGGLYWLEFDPQSARSTLYRWQDGQPQRLTPHSVRSRVYEYGGGAFCPTDEGVAFVDEADQQVHFAGDPPPIVDSGRRYGDLHHAAAWRAVLAVEESHEADGVRHRSVRLDRDGHRAVLVEGADFYAAPVLSPDGDCLAWTEWDRPQQPWTATRLCVRLASGEVRCLAGEGGDESLQQPRFAADGRLYCLSDRAGWWQPYALAPGPSARVGCAARTDPAAAPSVPGGTPCLSPVNAAHSAPYDHAAAPWQLGACSYLPLEHGGLLLTRFEQGFGVLVECDRDGLERRLAPSFSRFRSLAADARHFYCIAAAPERLPAVLAIRRADGEVSVLAGGERPLPEERLARPEPLRFASGQGETAHGFFYRPLGGGEKPPLVVFLHGGPTSACYPVFDPRIQFWSHRGFAVLDLNYRGSSGYGRAYRQRLKGAWGVVEVEDIRAAVAHLAGQGWIDPARVFVRGASAGGYSALCALMSGAELRGGASLYGVSDPLALRRATHKFEADYLDWLIGDPLRDAARYRERTPLFHAGRIAAPTIFFQGGLDAVVVPAQTESMVAALRARGVPVEYHCYPDERHGFRQAAHLADALEREYAFYQALL
ncbi:Prolyl oligopeptidase family protein [compost metagenome]